MNRIPFSELNELVNEPLSDDIVCLDIEDASKGRPSDDQVMMLIKEKTGATNSSAFQQLPADIKKSVLIELKGKRASLRQLERLTGISKSMIYRIPRGLMEGVAKIGGALHLPLNAERLQKLTENYVSSNAKIKKALGVEQLPVRAKDGLRMTIKSFEK